MSKRVPESEVSESSVYRLEADTQTGIHEIEREIAKKTKSDSAKSLYPYTLKVNFRNWNDCDRFAKLLGVELKVIDSTFVFNPNKTSPKKAGLVGEPKSRQKRVGLSDLHSEHWRAMPEFEQEDSNWLCHFVRVTFKNAKAYATFANLVRQVLSTSTRSIFYPKWTPEKVRYKRWVSSLPQRDLIPRYPIYIISLGRAYSRLTSKTLDAMRVPYYLVVEPQEYDAYASVIDPKKILTLPYTTDPKNPTGPGRARNWCRDHSFRMGYKRHWVMDDNIDGFYRLHRNRRYRVADGAIFRAAEDLVDRYENVWIAGFQYRFFCAAKSKYPPFVANTRIYSCLLIDNEMILELDGDQFLWRERYNEDTILSLDVLENGYCTIQFNAFLQGKVGTQTLRGGNSSIFYDVEGSADLKDKKAKTYNPGGTIRKSLNLVKIYPEVAQIAHRFGRVHHHVDYRKYRDNALILKQGLKVKERSYNYGMRLVDLSQEDAVAAAEFDELERLIKTRW